MIFGSYLPPVIADGQEGEHAGGDAEVRHKVVQLAVEVTKLPNSSACNLEFNRRIYLQKAHLSLMNTKDGKQFMVDINKSAIVKFSRK